MKTGHSGEGAMDVLAFEKADMHTALATLGTSCTKEQLQLLKALHAPDHDLL